MHDSRKVFLLDKEPRCVLATYEEHEGAERTEFKTWDQNIEEGDFVVVPTSTRHHMTVVKVVEVDVEPDLDCPSKMDWIVGVVDQSEFLKNAKQEERFIEMTRKAEKARRKRELKEAFLHDVDTTDIRQLEEKPAEE